MEKPNLGSLKALHCSIAGRTGEKNQTTTERREGRESPPKNQLQD